MLSLDPHDADPSVTWEVASHGRRFANYFLDGLLIGLINRVLLDALLRVGLLPPPPTTESLAEILDYAVLTLPVGLGIQLVYYTLFEALLYRTPGKLLTGTRVMHLDGTDPTFATALLRSLCRMVPFNALSFLGALNSGWHDRWTRTCVVRVQPAPTADGSAFDE